MRGLKGKRVIVTGGSMGIGKATVQRFAEEGCSVVLTARRTGPAQQATEEIKALTGAEIYAFAADVSKKADNEATVQFAIEKMGGVDILVNNAGIYYEEPFDEISEEHWDAIMDIDLKGTFLMCQAVLPHFKAKQSGTIVNMSSTNGISGENLYAHYNAAKGGVILLTKTLALEFGPLNIRSNSVCPGYITTESTEAMDSDEFVQNYIDNKIPLRRTGLPEEVASVIVFLSSDEASFVNGESILIDGGQLSD